MLEVHGLQTFYGASQVLFDLSFDVGAGEVVTLLGRNGMGKTTTVRSVMGLTPPRAGSVTFDGVPLAGRPSHAIARAGIALAPEGRQIFPTLTVRENLVATARPGIWDLAAIFGLFPRLDERQTSRGRVLSGGEQQMLTIGRALMTNPKLLILDEATEGLAPLVRAEIWNVLARLKHAGQAILVIDKNLAALSRLADRHVIIEKGRVAWTGASAALAGDADLQHRYLGV